MPDTTATIVDQVASLRDLVDDVVAGAARPANPDDRNDDRLRTLVVGLERLRHAAEAAQASAMVAIGREALEQDAVEQAVTELPTRSLEEFVPDELSVLLACTKATASLRYGTAWQAERYPALRREWQGGTIDGRKLGVIADQLQHLEPTAADALSATAAEYASRRTPSQTREWLRRRVIAIDPGAAEARRQVAVRDRRVVITPADDGMSELWAWLPSVDARRIQQALTHLAHGLGGDDERSMDQRRADVMTELLLGVRSAAPVSLQLIVPADTLTGAGDEPAWVPGVGPITATEARSLTGGPSTGAAGVIDRIAVLLSDRSTGTVTDVLESGYRPSSALDRAVRSRDVTCRFPGCRRAASGDANGTDLDHTVPWPHGPTTVTNLAVLCRRHHRLKHCGGWQVTLHPDGTMTWITPSGRRYATEPWQYWDDDKLSDPDPPGDPPTPD